MELVDGLWKSVEDLKNRTKVLEEKVEVLEGDLELSEIGRLQGLLREKGIEYHYNMKVPKLRELLETGEKPVKINGGRE